MVSNVNKIKANKTLRRELYDFEHIHIQDIIHFCLHKQNQMEYLYQNINNTNFHHLNQHWF